MYASTGSTGSSGSSGSGDDVAIAVGVLVPVVVITGAIIALVALLLLYLRTKHHWSSHLLHKTIEDLELQEGMYSYPCTQNSIHLILLLTSFRCLRADVPDQPTCQEVA